MKVFVAAALATLVVGQFAQAQTTSAASQGVETVSDVNGNGSNRTGASATTTLETNTADPVTTSTANLAKEIEAAAPRKVFGEFYSETYTDKTAFFRSEGTPRLDSYAGVKYDLGNSKSISIRQNFDYTGASAGGAGNFHIQDLALNFTNGKLASFAGDGAIIFIGRVYLPTGENDRNSKTMGAERVYLLGAKSYGKLDLTYVLLGQNKNFTQDTYMNTKGVETQVAWLTGVQELDAFYNVTPKFAVGALVGNEIDRKRAIANEDDLASIFYFQPTLQFAPDKNWTFQAAIYNEVNIFNPTQNFALMRDNELQVYFNVAASL